MTKDKEANKPDGEGSPKGLIYVLDKDANLKLIREIDAVRGEV